MQYSKKTISNSFIYKFAEQLLVKGTSLIISIVLARVLDVADFGIIAIIAIFTSLSSAIIEGGLSTSLIQKKNVSEIDYSTVFYTSVALAIVLYIILYICAPYIALYYENANLVIYLRVMGIVLFTTPFNSTQLGYVYRNMQFKKLLLSSFIASLISGTTGIILAYNDFGVWALIYQNLINNIFAVLMLFCLIEWKPKLLFSFKVLKSHFSFGWKLLVSLLIDTAYNEIRPIVIGKKFSPADLSFYNRGESYPKTAISIMNVAVQTVMLPVMSAEQDNKPQLKALMRRAVSTSAFLLFPVMAGIAAVAENIVLILLTEKWLPCVIYMQLSCIAYAIQPINSCNLQAIKAIGRSDVFLILTIIKRVIGIVMVIVVAAYASSPLAIAISVAAYAPIQLIINAFPNRKLLSYSFREQFADIAIPVLFSMIMFTVVYCIGFLITNVWICICVQIVSGISIYVLLSYITKNSSYSYLLNSIKNRTHS